MYRVATQHLIYAMAASNRPVLEVEDGATTVTLRVIKGKRWQLPMAETATHLYAIASEVLLDDAANAATKQMVHFLEVECGLSKHDAIKLLSIGGNLQICQVVDPLKTCRFELSRAILEKLGYPR